MVTQCVIFNEILTTSQKIILYTKKMKIKGVQQLKSVFVKYYDFWKFCEYNDKQINFVNLIQSWDRWGDTSWGVIEQVLFDSGLDSTLTFI